MRSWYALIALLWVLFAVAMAVYQQWLWAGLGGLGAAVYALAAACAEREEPLHPRVLEDVTEAGAWEEHVRHCRNCQERERKGKP
ncbi:hypothetical protein [Streptomyces sp. NPDC015131]|uniref:hypothetical protein n=1 Tax=Streptomyces sp. NPDC015131 TaxID=3364941 RepID=UPI0036FAB536